MPTTKPDNGRLLEILSLPLLLAVWQAVSALTGSRLLPGPVTVAEHFGALAANGPLLDDFARTMMRCAVAFVTSMLIGSGIGIALGRVSWLDRLLGGWLVVGLNLPAIVVGIVLYIWLGLTDFALVLAVVVNKVPLVATTLREGVRSLSADYDELARTFRMPIGRRLKLILMPQLMPFLLAAARTGISLVWKIVLVFEVLGSDGGVGFRIAVFFQFFDMAGILAYTIGFVGLVLAIEYGLMRPLESRLTAWRPARA
jgi:NitT/TauT family transport system permease protein